MFSLPFVYLPNALRLRDLTQRVFGSIDRFLFRAFPFLKYAAWTVFIRCSRPRD